MRQLSATRAHHLLLAVARRHSSGDAKQMGMWAQPNFKGYREMKINEAKHAAKATSLWRNLSLFVALPVVAMCMAKAYFGEKEHLSHPRAEFVPYEHLRRRTKPYPWGDGNHSLFHNSVYNALPDGYEAEDPNAGKHH